MKQNKLDRIFSWVDEDVVVLSSPLVITVLILTRALDSFEGIGNALAIIWCTYVFMAICRRYWYKQRCRKSGFRYFFMEPNYFILKFFKTKLGIGPKVNVCWRIHVDRSLMVKSENIRGMINIMRNDMSQLDDQEWDENVVLIGSTYAGLGKAQMRLLKSQGFDVLEYDYPLFKHYEWLVTKRKMLKDQDELAGKVYTVPKEPVWRTIIFSKR